jgi:mannitol-1-phosphate/altronate dehydrogenase
MSGGRTFAGFGFGPIQSGLFVYEAFSSGNFERFVIAEVDKTLVQAVRNNGGKCRLNIARKDRIDQCEVFGIELYDPCEPADRRKLIEAISQAREIATSLPSVKFFDADPECGVARLLADGLAARQSATGAIVYAAENNNHAAEILLDALHRHAGENDLKNVQILNTVIGKMSGVITDPGVMRRMNLATLTPDVPRAVLVEEFNHILVSRVTLEGFKRGIEVFAEKDDLLPFEEAKLYGHNAVHAMMGYLAELRGYSVMSQVGGDKWIMDRAREAFKRESASAVVTRHAHLNDALFTRSGYDAYADDLLERMVNPNLNDLVDRVGRDHLRKLSYEDRLFGTMNLAMKAGESPVNLSLGAAAGVISLIKRQGELKSPLACLPKRVEDLTRENLGRLLEELWQGKADSNANALADLTWRSVRELAGL